MIYKKLSASIRYAALWQEFQLFFTKRMNATSYAKLNICTKLSHFAPQDLYKSWEEDFNAILESFKPPKPWVKEQIVFIRRHLQNSKTQFISAYKQLLLMFLQRGLWETLELQEEKITKAHIRNPVISDP